MTAITSSPAALSRIDLDYTPDAMLDYFAPLAQQPWAMLLYSGGANHPHNRFDILVAQPLLTLTTRGHQTAIAENGNIRFSEQDPLRLVQAELSRLLPAMSEQADTPFCGGAVGLWGYDLGRRFETLPERAAADLSTPDMAVGIYDWALVADHKLKRLTLFVHGDAQSRLAWLAAQVKTPQPSRFQLTSSWQANLTQEEYSQRFARIHDYLHAGDCYQINLTQRFSASYQGDEWQAFLRLNEQNKAPFSAFVRLSESAILSVSPERFLQLEQKNISTRPIKGTLPRLADPVADQLQAKKLASSRKDQAENLMIVDLMRNDVGRVAQAGSVRVPELFVVEPFPAVHHLVSTITATLPNNLDATDLLRACFPGGSITGAPKIRAMQIIEELEPQRRNVYCGSIGYISCCGNMDTSITIRTLLAENGKLHCWAGGGIVADSQVDAEYQETFDKVGKILPILGDVEVSA
ncbi:aminodeoxychorismate synthase component 1 [Hafnia alvei]|uniref:aminodeoxychorismate synthase component 1 n=1 Tax=Hafnia alvei TaxID=569 RepID=UPI004044B4D7